MKTRIALGVVAGYALIAFIVMTLFTLAFKLLGPDGAFRPGSWDVSPIWILLWFVVSLLAAIIGGLAAGVIAKGDMGPRILAGVIFVLGVATAIPEMTRPAGEVKPRPPIVSNEDAMRNAQQPPWMALSNPVLGVVGVLIGAALRRRAEDLRSTT